MNNSICPDFIFWLHAYNTTLFPNRSRELLRCSINQTNLTIEDAEGGKVIPLDHMISCRRLPPSRVSQIEIWIEYSEEDKKQSCYLLCADPLRPKHYPYDGGEATALVDVINSLRLGQTPKLSPNPYERVFVRRYRQQEFDPQQWDAMKSPLEYWEAKQKEQPATSVWRILGFTILIVLVTSLILAFFFGGIIVKF